MLATAARASSMSSESMLDSAFSSDRPGETPRQITVAGRAPAPRAGARASGPTTPRHAQRQASYCLAASPYPALAEAARQAVVNHGAQRPAPQDDPACRSATQHSNYLHSTTRFRHFFMALRQCMQNYVGALDHIIGTSRRGREITKIAGVASRCTNKASSTRTPQRY
jgi:hypothetical protein